MDSISNTKSQFGTLITPKKSIPKTMLLLCSSNYLFAQGPPPPPPPPGLPINKDIFIVLITIAAIWYALKILKQLESK